MAMIDLPDRKRIDLSPADGLHECRGRLLAQDFLLATVRAIEQGPVLGDHSLEEADLGEDLQQFGQFPTRDQDEPSARVAKSLEGRQDRVIHLDHPWPAYRHNPWPVPGNASGNPHPMIERESIGY